MEVCAEVPRLRQEMPTLLDVKNKIRMGHNECCSCCCCKAPNFCTYKYIQPEIPKPFRPIACYYKPNIRMEDETTYKLSFWPGPSTTTEPIIPEGNLTVAEGLFAGDTIQKSSYVGNWCIKPQEKILPCKRNLFGGGPMQDRTTQKQDFPWKCGYKEKPIICPGSLCIPKKCLEDDTTYKLSYFNSPCLDPVKSFKPITRYERADDPVEGYTTYNLSFFKNEPPAQEKYPWQEKLKYIQPTTPLEGCTTYKLSYWPQCPDPAKPILPRSHDNLLNKDCCFNECTTYGLSYFGDDGDKPKPILPVENQIFDDCPVNHKTVNKLSFMGNWCPKPEKPIVPCTRQLLGRGPMQDATTQKCDYSWKCGGRDPSFKPINTIMPPVVPIECNTTTRLSYMPNCFACLSPNKSFAPIQKYERVDIPMDLDTTMQLSYQPVEEPEKLEKPWAAKPAYQKPVTNLEDDTTYKLSYIPPGTLVPCCPENSCDNLPSSCYTSACPQVSAPDTRPCISC